MIGVSEDDDDDNHFPYALSKIANFSHPKSMSTNVAGDDPESLLQSPKAQEELSKQQQIAKEQQKS